MRARIPADRYQPHPNPVPRADPTCPIPAASPSDDSSSGSHLPLRSRIPIGLLKQSLTVSRAIIADCTRPNDRVRPMAALGATVGCGFVIGPAFGGALAKRLSLPTPSLIAVGLFCAVALHSTSADPTHQGVSPLRHPGITPACHHGVTRTVLALGLSRRATSLHPTPRPSLPTPPLLPSLSTPPRAPSLSSP